MLLNILILSATVWAQSNFNGDRRPASTEAIPEQVEKVNRANQATFASVGTTNYVPSKKEALKSRVDFVAEALRNKEGDTSDTSTKKVKAAAQK